MTPSGGAGAKSPKRPQGRVFSEALRMAKLRAFGPRLSAIETRRVIPPAKTADPFYRSPEWQALLGRLIRERGRRCEDQQHDPAQSRTDRRIYGDHIVELKDGGAPLDPANILLRCAPCHGRKTAAARAARFGVKPA